MRKGNVLRGVTEWVGLYGEPLPGGPLVELSGDDRVLIENHKCVNSYSPEEISVRVSFGCIRLCGRALVLACVGKDQLVVHGKVDSITVERR